MRTDPSELRTVFQELLNLAITQGRTATAGLDLGCRTTAAIDRVAHEHPDATADLIADAYDIFQLEHG